MAVLQCLALGLTHDDIGTRVRRDEYRRVWRGVLLVDAELYDEVPFMTRVQAAVLRHGPNAVVGLGTAAQLLGIAGADVAENVVELILPPGNERSQVPGIALHLWEVPAAETCEVASLKITNRIRTLADLVPRLRRNCAVAAMDSALRSKVISKDELLLSRALTAGRPYCQRSLDWWALADGRAESPLETWARLDCIDHDLPRDELQWKVQNEAGDVLGVGDMAWTRQRKRVLVAEADGRDPHSLPAAVFADRLRANNFVGAQVDIVRLTWNEARHRGRCAALVRQALNIERPMPA